MNIETANRLLQYRKKFNFSQEELAAKIGVSRQAISKWERAEASPDTDNLMLLADIYGVSLDELLKGKTPQKNSDDSSEQDKAQSDSNEDNKHNYSYAHGSKGETETSYKKVDKISFLNGIHIDSKDGDHVHIGFNGLHINDKHGTNVDIDSSGINVEEDGKQWVYTDENGNVMYDQSLKHHHDRHKHNIWHKFPFFIIAIIAFLCWGFSGECFGWALSWICFLSIPIYHTLIEAIYNRKPSQFAYPVLAAAVYILFGFFNICGGWSVSWVIFLTIPVYYWICSLLKCENEYNNDCNHHAE